MIDCLVKNFDTWENWTAACISELMTLVETNEKIRTYLNSLPPYNYNTVNWFQWMEGFITKYNNTQNNYYNSGDYREKMTKNLNKKWPKFLAFMTQF